MSEGVLDEKHWRLQYPDCGGTRQSPIDLKMKKVRYNPSLRALNLTGYGLRQGEFPMTNNGHTGKDGRQTGFCPWGKRAVGEAGRAARSWTPELQSVAWGLQVLSPGTSSRVMQQLSVDSVPHSPLHFALASLQAHSDPTSGNSADRQATQRSCTAHCVFC